MPDDKEDGKIPIKKGNAYDAIALGFIFPLSILGGFGIGYYLDKFFNTGSVMTIIFTTLGIAGAFVQLFRFGKSSDGG